MSFYDLLMEWRQDLRLKDPAAFNANVVERALGKDTLEPIDYMALLSPAALPYLEKMAQKAHRLSIQNFGRAIVLYAPIYLSNHCVNYCLYCGFNASNRIKRKTMTLEEVEREGQALAETGIRHIVVLTGESSHRASMQYIAACIKKLTRYFSSLSIEVYPLDTNDYLRLVDVGVDNLTIYQEVYNPNVYELLHPRGPKRDFRYRLEAPERAGMAHIRGINVGALLGLEDWRQEAFFTGLHAYYLQNTFPDTEIAVSVPRIRPEVGGFMPREEVTDPDLVQIIVATRLFLPRAGLTLSTRESRDLRDNLIPLGITKISAGSSTKVGGYALGDTGEGQFEISDNRSVREMHDVIIKMGYEPVFKDWYPLQEKAY